jgi:hypothetical protein
MKMYVPWTSSSVLMYNDRLTTNNFINRLFFQLGLMKPNEITISNIISLKFPIICKTGGLRALAGIKQGTNVRHTIQKLYFESVLISC